MASWKGRGNQYIQFVKVLYCNVPTNGKQLPAFPLEAVLGTEPRQECYHSAAMALLTFLGITFIFLSPDVNEFWCSMMSICLFTKVKTGDHLNALLVSLMALWLMLVDRNPLGLFSALCA